MNNRTLDFISKLLKDILKLDMHYFVEPYNNISVFDRYLRDSLKNSDQLYQTIYDFILKMEHSSFHIITDLYDMNYVMFYPYAEKKDIISIGPYFTQKINNDYWLSLTERHKLTRSDAENLKGFLYSTPVISNNLDIISTISNIINYINPEATPFSVLYHDSSDIHMDTNNSHFQFKEDYLALAKQLEERYATEKELLHYISIGDSARAFEAAKRFINSPFEQRLSNSIRELKSLLITANTAYRKAVEVNEIHPVYLHEITSKFVNLIEDATSEASLNNLFEKMIREYCLLVNNKSVKQYSPMIRKILHYIEFNLDAKISLGDLAKLNEVSIPYLAGQFKKEVGETIIKYTNHLRIETAIKLLNTSSLSIQDIASYVGILDYNYFTKVFKKEIGISPSQYRKKITDN
jgi:AraC-like DNA-binding protein